MLSQTVLLKAIPDCSSKGYPRLFFSRLSQTVLQKAIPDCSSVGYPRLVFRRVSDGDLELILLHVYTSTSSTGCYIFSGAREGITHDCHASSIGWIRRAASPRCLHVNSLKLEMFRWWWDTIQYNSSTRQISILPWLGKFKMVSQHLLANTTSTN